MSKQKKLFTIIILLLITSLITLPFLVSINEGLTRIVENNLLYAGIQKSIVPIEARMLGGLLRLLGYSFAYNPANSYIIANGVTMGITWNCIGWQSFVLLIVTFLVGFGGRYTGGSALETIGIGLLGTFWVNIVRMLATILLAVQFPPVFRIVFHNYLAAGVTVVWLVFFWWFSYKFVLQEK